MFKISLDSSYLILSLRSYRGSSKFYKKRVIERSTSSLQLTWTEVERNVNGRTHKILISQFVYKYWLYDTIRGSFNVSTFLY